MNIEDLPKSSKHTIKITYSDSHTNATANFLNDRRGCIFENIVEYKVVVELWIEKELRRLEYEYYDLKKLV